MNLLLTEKLKVKPNPSDEKHLPKNVNTKEYYDVVGFEFYRKKLKQKNENDPEKWTTVINFLIINDVMKLTSIASWNCDVIVNEQK